MFPEYQGLIDRLKTSDSYFLQLCERHQQLADQVHKLEAHTQIGTFEELESLKKEKLRVKDQIYTALKKAAA